MKVQWQVSRTVPAERFKLSRLLGELDHSLSNIVRASAR